MTEKPGESLRGQIYDKNLRMIADVSVLDRLPEVHLPDGYFLRAFSLGDEDGWLKLLQDVGFENWDCARLDDYLDDKERRVGSCLVIKNRTVVAATFASRTTIDGADMGLLDYVASSPAHRGKNLGRAVCTRVARFFVDRGYVAVALNTQDWRLPAIGLYLSMGFVPVFYADDMKRRWDEVMVNLCSRSS